MENTNESLIFVLPSELLKLIFSSIDLRDVVRASVTSKQWQKISLGSICEFVASMPNPTAFARALSKLSPINLRSIDITLSDSREDEVVPELRILEKFTKLQKMRLHEFNNEDLDIIIRSITYIQQLTILNIEDDQFQTISCFLTNLTSLDLSISSMIAMPGVSTLTRLNNLNLSFGNKITNAAMRNIFGYLTNLTRLEIFRCDEVTGKGLQPISQLKNLKFLDMGTLQCYKAEHLTVLQTLPNLEALDFWFFNGLTDNALRSVGDISQLTKLAVLVGNGQVTSRGLENLSNLSRLVDLLVAYNSPGTQIFTTHFMSHLTNLTRLETTMISYEEMSVLTTLQNLRIFNVHTGSATKEFFMNLAKLTALSSLSLNAIMDYMGYAHLPLMTNLTSLNINRCDYMEEDPRRNHLLVSELVKLTKLKALYLAEDHNNPLLSKLTNLEELSIPSSFSDHDLTEWAPLIMLPRLRIFKSSYAVVEQLKNAFKTSAPNVQILEIEYEM